MYKSEWNIMEKLEPMLTGKDLIEGMKVLPKYEDNVRSKSQAERLMELNNIYSFYLPSDMSVEIYTKLYLAMIRSLRKKESKLAIRQRNINGTRIKAYANGMESSFEGVIGGSNSFSIIGYSGVGKTTAISKSVKLMGGERIIEMDNPYCKIIPVINVACPFDCSAKSMLLSILQKIDVSLGTSYYDMTVRAKANINTIIVSTAQILLNHVAVLVIDEIQNLIKHRAGMQLVSMLTELLNESGISIVFVATPEIQPFFQSMDYLARRTLGLYYERCNYNEYFRDFCIQLWEFQYIKQKQEISDDIIHWLYQHSSGTLSHVLFLFQAAQENSILNGRETLDIQALESAYQRMRMLHTHIQPEIELKQAVSKKKRVKVEKSNLSDGSDIIQAEEKTIMQHTVEKGIIRDWTFSELANESKKKQVDIVSLLSGKISVTEVCI